MLQDSEKLINSNIDNIIEEQINADEPSNFKIMLKSIINNKKDLGIIEINKENLSKIIKYNIGVIPIRMTSQNTMIAIVYHDKSKALRLYEIMKNKGGHLRDSSPIEAREIGRLLGHSEDAIKKYIDQKYGSKNFTNSHVDLTEQELEKFEKEIQVDNTKETLNKRLLRQEDDFKVYAINGKYVRGNDPGLDFNGFTDGGSYYVTSLPGYRKWIPEDEIWVDDVFLPKPTDIAAIMLHEKLERHLMKFYGVPYDTAHADYAEKAESMFRGRVKSAW